MLSICFNSADPSYVSLSYTGTLAQRKVKFYIMDAGSLATKVIQPDIVSVISLSASRLLSLTFNPRYDLPFIAVWTQRQN